MKRRSNHIMGKRTGMLFAGLVILVTCMSSLRAAGLLVADGGLGGVLEVKEHDVRVAINNGIAVTEVEEVFVNTESRVVEALYSFPVPNGASVANFSMWINGKEMIGEVVEKKRARQIYESYKQVRRDPGLLEQADYKTFEMRIFPIPARGEQRVKVTYYQELDFDHDQATYVYPLATTTKGTTGQRTTGRFSMNLRSKSEVPITKMDSPSHQEAFVIVNRGEHVQEASLEVTGGDLNRDLVIHYSLQRPQSGLDVIASKQKGEDGYLLMTLTSGQELDTLDVGMDFVFVLDISGSMAQDGKLRLSRDSVGAFVKTLGEKDRFEVIAFNAAPTSLFRQLSATDQAAKGKAMEFLDSQMARGGTVLRPAIEEAYRHADSDRVLNVVILSDGLTEQREQRELLQLIASRPKGSRVFCIGVGNDVNRPLLAQLATDAGGLSAFISQGDDFARQAQAFRRKLTRAAASNVKITFDGQGVYDATPGNLPNLFHGSPLRLYARYRKSGVVNVTIDAEVLGKALHQTHQIQLPDVDDGNPEIERMWASHRITELLDESRRNGSIDSVVGQIVELCEGYSIVSEYASFIVLENDGEYQRWKIARKNATRIERDRAAQARLRVALDSMQVSATADIGPGGAEQKAAVVPQTNSRGPVQPTSTPVQPSTGRNVNFNVGGGAIDPVSGMAIVLLAGLYAVGKCRRGK